MSDPTAKHPDDSTPPPLPLESPFAPGSPFAEHYRPPRLGIIHLLAWTAATAVLLKFWISMEVFGRGGDDSMQVALEIFRQVPGFIYSTAHAAGIVATGVLLTAKARRAAGRLQPGHWLVVTETVVLLLILIGCNGYVPWLAGEVGLIDYPTFPWNLVVHVFACPLGSAVYFYATLASEDGRRWKICFAALAAFYLMWGLYYAGSLFGGFWLPVFPCLQWTVSGLVLLVAVVLDFRSGPRRDRLHWVGVAIIAMPVLLCVAWWVWSMFVNRLM